MTRYSDFLARLSVPPTLPARITAVQIDLHYTPDAATRGVPARMAQMLGLPFGDVSRLFAAGFAAIDPDHGQDIAFDIHSTENRVRISCQGAAHRAMMLYCVLRLLETTHQTPDGAYERLLDLLDGDTAAAQAAFKPINIIDMTRIEVVVAGDEPPMSFAYDTPPLLRDLAGLAAAIDAETDQMVFDLQVDATLSEPVDHGFLVLQNAGVFQPPQTQDPVRTEPEVFLSAPRQLHVLGWRDAAFGLAELLWLICDGQTAGIVRRDAG